MVIFSKQLLFLQNICDLLKYLSSWYKSFQRFWTHRVKQHFPSWFLSPKTKQVFRPLAILTAIHKKKSQSSVKSTLNQHIFFRQIAAHAHRRLNVDLLWFGRKKLSQLNCSAETDWQKNSAKHSWEFLASSPRAQRGKQGCQYRHFAERKPVWTTEIQVPACALFPQERAQPPYTVCPF